MFLWSRKDMRQYFALEVPRRRQLLLTGKSSAARLSCSALADWKHESCLLMFSLFSDLLFILEFRSWKLFWFRSRTVNQSLQLRYFYQSQALPFRPSRPLHSVSRETSQTASKWKKWKNSLKSKWSKISNVTQWRCNRSQFGVHLQSLPFLFKRVPNVVESLGNVFVMNLRQYRASIFWNTE